MQLKGAIDELRVMRKNILSNLMLVASVTVLASVLPELAFAESPPYIPPPPSGGSGGAPVPLLGVTLLGQAGLAAGGFALWRKRNRKKQ
ncbi:MAG: hypothetical protein ACK5JT_17190 [Hyphomicrobiaceae bacterium]